ncbi:DUF4326 domain-containing protein [uncultured Sphingomonas sp.]|jgi:hypothetical protein|uniref:DUF4326 domain-containing protein n=1 Tax=uncultured Sphingomonas sp. TaxID=158754 RepID=UPI0030D8489A
MPQRLHRTRRRANFTPTGAVYVGRPTIFSNPFERRPKIGQKRSVILHAAWLHGRLDPHVLACAGMSDAEIHALRRMRHDLVAAMPRLRGRDLQCWCPLTSDWCHADTLLRAANR